MKQIPKKIFIYTVLTVAIVISIISNSWLNSVAKTRNSTIQYNNNVFTKNLYKNTAKIGFGSDGSLIAKDKKTVKKVYKLLAGMKLEINQDQSDEKRMGFVTLVIHKNNGKEKTYMFCDDKLSINNKVYTITKNNPLEKLHDIYESIEPSEN